VFAVVFDDRDHAGRRLAARLGYLRSAPAVVLGLPRGGVPVAFQVARALDAPLDVIVVRKLGVPWQPELAMGAVGEGGVRVINRDVVATAGVREEDLDAAVNRERSAVEARAERYRALLPRQPLEGRVAVVVDDGIATGATARAACQVARAYGAARVVLAVPVAPPGWQGRIGAEAHELVCVRTPPGFFAISQYYATFPTVTDDEVIACLRQATEVQRRARRPPGRAAPGGAPGPG
jgi:putative phosphoribosyl transferase